MPCQMASSHDPDRPIAWGTRTPSAICPPWAEQGRIAPTGPLMHVLVCDDDASTRFAAKRLLEEHFGCVVHEAPGGAEALTLLAQHRYTFLLLDVDMPGLSGHDTLEEIRASELTKNLPVVVLSNERREHAIIKLMQLGISDYILKPIRPNTFTAKLEAVIERLPRSMVDAVDAGSILVKQDSPALIADGNLDFRFFFANQVQRYGPVVQDGEHGRQVVHDGRPRVPAIRRAVDLPARGAEVDAAGIEPVHRHRVTQHVHVAVARADSDCRAA